MVANSFKDQQTITGSRRRVASARPIGPGSYIDRFRLDREVGSGGMGVVFAAHDTLLDRKVAIKVVHPHCQTEPDQRDRIVTEARAMAKLSHANVIAIHAIRRWQDSYCVVMELVEGVNLGRWLAQRPRDTSEIWPVFALAGRGLQAAHRAGIVHRDFKPGNVLVDVCGQVKVTDFGLAQLLSLDEPVSLATGSVADRALPIEASSVHGTPAYMAPEQFDNRGIDARADQFSFCVALFEALYGNRPYAGATFTQLSLAVREGEPREPVNPERAPKEVLSVLQQGMSRAPSDRFADMGELLDALDRAFACCSSEAALLAALARAEVALQTEELATARGLATSVIARAALDSRPEADARARMILARCASQARDGEAADRHLHACLKSAAAAQDDPLVARAWGMRAYVAAFLRKRPSEADGYCLAAEIAALRADDALARDYVSKQVSAVQDFLGQATEVLRLLQEGAGKPSETAASNQLSQLDLADAAARRGVEILEAALGPNDPILAFSRDTAANIAMALGDCARGQAPTTRAQELDLPQVVAMQITQTTASDDPRKK